MSISEKLTTIAENTPKVFNAGVKSEYDRFWDNYQENGNRTNYVRAFANSHWSTELFKPKYDIYPINAETIFYTNNSIADPESILNALGLKLDFSRCTNFVQFLSYCAVKRLGTVDTRSATTLRLAFYSAQKLETIEKLILAEDGSQTIENSTSFTGMIKLQEIRIEGLFGQSVSFSSSTLLSLESLKSIINALKDYSGTENEGINKVTFSGESKNKLEIEGSTSPNGNTWLEYIRDKGWTY